ncbi:hypothetical protein [Spirosoma aerophilum]
MKEQQSVKKAWVAPTVQTLNINSETYVNPGRGDREVGLGGGENKNKTLS